MNTNSQFEDLLKEFQPELLEKVHSKQYRISKEILKERLKYNLSIDIVADLMKMSTEEYLDFEFGEIDSHSVEKYELFLERLKLTLYTYKFSQLDEILLNNSQRGFVREVKTTAILKEKRWSPVKSLKGLTSFIHFNSGLQEKEIEGWKKKEISLSKEYHLIS